MKVLNKHERAFDAGMGARVGALIDTLASDDDKLWPAQSWPPMKLDRPLGVSAVGGHGPIRYFVKSYTPGTSVVFHFTGPKGFDGQHRFELLPIGDGPVLLRHTVEMTTFGLALVTWPLVFEPLHDALIEDALAQAQANVGVKPEVVPWNGWVKFLRWVFAKGRSGPQVRPQLGNK